VDYDDDEDGEGGKQGKSIDDSISEQKFILTRNIIYSFTIYLVVRDRPRGHVCVTGGLGRAHSAGKSTVDHDEWLQVGLEVVI
jgi:hypothetical protein